jgi:hypothetical protein
VEAHKIEESKFAGKGKCLHLQIMVGSSQHVVFTGSSTLIEMIRQVPTDRFPFRTTIVQDNERFIFT